MYIDNVIMMMQAVVPFYAPLHMLYMFCGYEYETAICNSS